MNAPDEVAYRLALAKGFLAEAEQDMQLQRWRSCVDNAQLTVENVGKSALALFSVAPKTHEPARQLAALLRKESMPPTIQRMLQELLPDLLALGADEHFLTDCGDEATRTLPWDLFNHDSAADALGAARHSYALAQELVAAVNQGRQ